MYVSYMWLNFSLSPRTIPCRTITLDNFISDHSVPPGQYLPLDCNSLSFRHPPPRQKTWNCLRENFPGGSFPGQGGNGIGLGVSGNHYLKPQRLPIRHSSSRSTCKSINHSFDLLFTADIVVIFITC